jgi:hypothetical protein
VSVPRTTERGLDFSSLALIATGKFNCTLLLLLLLLCFIFAHHCLCFLSLSTITHTMTTTMAILFFVCVLFLCRLYVSYLVQHHISIKLNSIFIHITTSYTCFIRLAVAIMYPVQHKEEKTITITIIIMRTRTRTRTRTM